MIALVFLVLGCIYKSFWLIFVGFAIDAYFVDKKIKALKERIEDLEDNQNKEHWE